MYHDTMDDTRRRHYVCGLSKKCYGQSPVAASLSFNQSEDACRGNRELNHLDMAISCEDSSSLINHSASKIKRESRIRGGGLRQFSLIVCKKLESKGRTTYNEIADEIIAEYATEMDDATNLDEGDRKNIRRWVYDALNVLMAMDIISKDKKEIMWRGFPYKTMEEREELKSSMKGLRTELNNSIATKAAYLKDLQEQIAGLQKLMARNKQLVSNGKAPFGISLPFLLVQTSPDATVEIEMSESMKLVHIDFNSTPFVLHDDAQILQLMQPYQHKTE